MILIMTPLCKQSVRCTTVNGLSSWRQNGHGGSWRCAEICACCFEQGHRHDAARGSSDAHFAALAFGEDLQSGHVDHGTTSNHELGTLTTLSAKSGRRSSEYGLERPDSRPRPFIIPFSLPDCLEQIGEQILLLLTTGANQVPPWSARRTASAEERFFVSAPPPHPQRDARDERGE